MKHIVIILFVFIGVSCSTKSIVGTYITKYREFENYEDILNINCDGTTLKINRYDKNCDSLFGTWKYKRDTLTLTYRDKHLNDTKREEIYHVERNKLVYVSFTKADFNKVKNQMIANGLSDTLKKKEYSMFENVDSYNKFINRVPIDYKDNFRSQYFKKKSLIQCDKTTANSRLAQ